MTRVVLLLALAGCDVFFAIDPVGSSDAAGVDPPPACMTVPVDQDTFDNTGGTPCASWGIDDAFLSTVAVTGGALSITPNVGVPSSRGGCESSNPVAFVPSGVFAEVTQPASGATEYMLFCAYVQGGTPWCIKWGGGQVLFDALGGTQFDAAATRWVRLRPSASRDAVIGETSSDAANWTSLGAEPVPSPMVVPQEVKISVLMGTYASETAPSTARFDTVNICP